MCVFFFWFYVSCVPKCSPYIIIACCMIIIINLHNSCAHCEICAPSQMYMSAEATRKIKIEKFIIICERNDIATARHLINWPTRVLWSSLQSRILYVFMLGAICSTITHMWIYFRQPQSASMMCGNFAKIKFQGRDYCCPKRS